MELRPFSIQDADRARSIFRSRSGSYFDVAEAEDFEETLEFIRHPGDAPEKFEFWSGWLEGDFVAFGGIEWLDDAGYLCWGTVAPSVSGRGYGRQLLKHRLDVLVGLRVKSIFSDTSQLTEGFYARYGFQTYHRALRYFGPTLDLAAMELSLDGVRRGPRRIRSDGTLGYRVARE